MDKLKVGEFTDLFYPTLNGVTKVVDKLSNALGETDCAEVRVSATRGQKGRMPEPPADRACDLQGLYGAHSEGYDVFARA